MRSEQCPPVKGVPTRMQRTGLRQRWQPAPKAGRDRGWDSAGGVRGGADADEAGGGLHKSAKGFSF